MRISRPYLKAWLPSDSATLEEKVAELTALGTPALPYILDRVGEGSTELAPAVVTLAEGTLEAREAVLSAPVTQAWAREHAAAFDDLRAIVEAQRDK